MEKTEYLNISKASDIKNDNSRRIYRFFEIIPAMISLGTLIGVFVFSWLLPSLVSIFVIMFCFYYLFRILYFSMHQIVGYRKVKSHMKTDWMVKLKKARHNTAPGKSWKDIYHIVILPTYKEGGKIIKETIDSLIQADYPKEKIIIVLSIEQKAGKEFWQMAKRIEQEYAGTFFAFLAVAHPSDIEGEMAGKGSNVAFAGQQVKEKIIDVLKIPYENILISTFDIDTKIYPQYFSCLTWYYLTEKNPTRASYQPIPIYNNNIWKASLFARVVSTSNTFWQMICQERAEKLTTYSSHATPAVAFYEVGYPTNVVSDDSRIFWRAYFYYNGDYRVVPIYYLVSMDAVESTNIIKTAINQYKQQKRWAWGVAEIPYVMFGFLHNTKISFSKKISHIYTLLDGYWSWATASLLLFVLGWLPILLGGPKFNFTVLSFNLPILTGRVMTISLIGMLVSALLSTMLLPPIPKGVSRLKRISVFVQWIFLPITLILFGALPALDAQIRLLFGRYMGFWVTEKRR
ncbi:MAG: glycosyltransferase family 2 protein [Candidatus Staskawiczbacteria bacterium]|nr:glycosyltransferase family 2 protein [Candidatus Staskawiczbacteria bacterium]